MLKVIFCLIPFTCFSMERPLVKRFNYELHSYLCFNGSQIIHDPDCPCDTRFSGYAVLPDGKTTYIELVKSPPVTYD